MEGKFRATQWLNTDTLNVEWGLWFTPNGKRVGLPVCENGKAVLFDNESDAKKKAQDLNKEG